MNEPTPKFGYGDLVEWRAEVRHPDGVLRWTRCVGKICRLWHLVMGGGDEPVKLVGFLYDVEDQQYNIPQGRFHECDLEPLSLLDQLAEALA